MAIPGKRSVERNVLVVANDGTFCNNRLDIWVETVLSSPFPPPSTIQSTSFATQLRYNFIERCLSVCRSRGRIVLLRSAYVRHAEGWLTTFSFTCDGRFRHLSCQREKKPVSDM